MITADITESPDAYAIDLFTPPDPDCTPSANKLWAIRAFVQQMQRLAELDAGRVPESLRFYLRVTDAMTDAAEQLPLHLDVHRRYRQEWLAIAADAARRRLPWAFPTRPMPLAQGAAK
jgi:hypothetical protein